MKVHSTQPRHATNALDWNFREHRLTNLPSIRERIATAAMRARNAPDDIALMAVCKTFPAEAIVEAYAAGQRLFGENRVQEFADKFPQVSTN